MTTESGFSQSQIETIARTTHEMNKAYCERLGDTSQKPWDEAPAWQKESAISGVKFALANPKVTPAEMHEKWLAHKEADGWTYGAVKDPEKKQHPCFVPYDQLPPDQQKKDEIFKATVETCLLVLKRAP